MRRYGYDQEKCDRLKRDRKNITNKIYRRRQKLKSLDPDSSSRSSIENDIQSLKDQVTRLNIDIWKCSKQYATIKQKQDSVRRSISYRNKKLKSLAKDSKLAKRYRREKDKLQKEKVKLDRKAFSGSPQWISLQTNYLRIKDQISKLQKQYKKSTDNTSRARLKNKIQKLGNEKRRLEELISDKELARGQFQRKDVVLDRSKGTETYTMNIYNYVNALDTILTRRNRDYNQVIIGGDQIDTKIFQFPSQSISIDLATMNAEVMYAQDASSVQVIIVADNQNKVVAVTYEYVPIN